MFFGFGGSFDLAFLIWHPEVLLTNPFFLIGGSFDSASQSAVNKSWYFLGEGFFALASEIVVTKSWCFFWWGDLLIWHAKVWLTNPGVFLGWGIF